MNRKLILVSILMTVSCALSAQKYQGGLVDKSVALIGGDVIMLSDIESEAQVMRARGLVVDQNARCEIMEQMLTSKLFLTQARLDSLDANPQNIEAELENRVNEVLYSLGGEKEAEAYFGKPMYKLKQEWRTTLEEQSLIQAEQSAIYESIPELTPSDVKKYVKETPEEDLPMVSTKYRVRQICVYPDRDSAKLAVKEALISLRERIVNGEKFSTLARLYSEDPGSMTKGGELGMASKSIFWPAFSDAAMALKIGQVSQIVETPDGYHIIELIDRDGDNFNARHILMKPKYTTKDLDKAFKKLDSIKTLVVKDSMDFQTAARAFSEDRSSATSGGLMTDQYSGSSYFEKDQLKPADYAVLKNMKEGDISEPFESLDNEGRNGNTMYKIVYLEKVLPAHVANFKEDFTDLLNEANNKNAAEAIEKFIQSKQKTTYIVIDPLFQSCEFEHPGWVK